MTRNLSFLCCSAVVFGLLLLTACTGSDAAPTDSDTPILNTQQACDVVSVAVQKINGSIYDELYPLAKKGNPSEVAGKLDQLRTEVTTAAEKLKGSPLSAKFTEYAAAFDPVATQLQGIAAAFPPPPDKTEKQLDYLYMSKLADPLNKQSNIAKELWMDCGSPKVELPGSPSSSR
ncbi:hypothetical protein [Psychromicrobium sp. YIM B11713]|uniref:hypothetical protein n=1 Tax=Psychromicrobium sp. YIM B11713 TaxID=3145233 RepID=UPI00374E36D8